MSASGYYHRYNFLKFKILWVLGRSEEPLTAQQIADTIGIDRKKITDALGHWHSKQYGYTQRMKRKAEKSKAYRYQITKKGREILQVYDNRIRNRLQLNISKKNKQPANSSMDYYGINKKGEEMGLTKEKLYEMMHKKPAKSLEPEPQKAELGNNGH